MISQGLFLTLCLAAVFQASSALKLPSYIKPCSKNEANFDECALKNGKAAIPKLLDGDAKYRIPNLKPLEVEEIEVGEGPAGGIGLQMTCKKCKFYGIETSKLEAIHFDLQKKTIHLEVTNPKIEIVGKYTAAGKVLVLPITGNGDANISLENVKLKYDVYYELIKKNGKEHMKLKNPKLEIDTSGMTFKLTNLFNGDKLLGDNMNTFLNENWREVIKEFGPAVSETLSQVITIIVNNITDLVPFDEVFA